jgi:hypothetical protein
VAFDLVLFLLLRSKHSLLYPKKIDSKVAEKIMPKGPLIDYIVFDMCRLTEKNRN